MLYATNELLDAKTFIEKLEERKRIKKLQKRKKFCAIVSLITIILGSIISTHILLSHDEKNIGVSEAQFTQLATTNNVSETTKENVISETPIISATEPTPIESIESSEESESEGESVDDTVTDMESVNKESLSIYNANIPMPKEHQEYLYKLCTERGLDYKYVLSVLKNESQFDSNCISDDDYGYFQINKVNHNDLSKKLETTNKALDPYVNINWGTYMLSNIYDKWSGNGYSGDELNNIVLSEYNKGAYGFKKWGIATEYIRRVNSEKRIIDDIFS